ncbi:MAG TPA: NAD(P)-binding protein, partial [Pseudonocardiaceae bacterium]|nr:NAD(P)-binding protein [Pseudonocardiaceae bacterium]
MKALVVGAGIGGLAAAAALRRAGIKTEVYEQAPELRAAGTGLSVMTNAILALRTIGLDLGVDLGVGGTVRGARVETAEIFTARGRLIRRTPFKEICDRLGAPSVCVHRGDLQTALLDVAGEPITLGAQATCFSRGNGGVRVDFADGTRAHGDVLIGADGVNSVVRAQLA